MTGKKFRKGVRVLIFVILALIAKPNPLLTPNTRISAISSANSTFTLKPTAVIPPWEHINAYPTDPGGDISWSGGTGGVADIQTAFNNARSTRKQPAGHHHPDASAALARRMGWHDQR